MIQSIINHIVFVVDRSGSMNERGKAEQVVQVFDKQVAHWAKRSKETNQETRVSVYLFNTTTECLIYDMDVLRLPSLKGYYKAQGGTALIDATLKAIEDAKRNPELYCDHATLLYVLSDGEENQRPSAYNELNNAIQNLPENYTVACQVPNAAALAEAKRFGFPAANIQVWSSDDARGVEEIGERLTRSADTFMALRSKGIRSTKSLFSLDASNLSKTEVKSNLKELKPDKDYILLPVRKDQDIKSFVESWTQKPYRVNSAFYELGKTETIQAYKQICVMEKTNGKVYGGTVARQLLGLPDYEIKVNPTSFGEYKVFCQSSSTNRKLIKGTQLLVMQ